jgi:hypothetical protein
MYTNNHNPWTMDDGRWAERKTVDGRWAERKMVDEE